MKAYAYPKMFQPGTVVERYSEDYQEWYPAKVLSVFSGLHFIHYDGYGSEYDDWMAPKKIRATRRMQ